MKKTKARPQIPGQEWKELPGYNGDYWVSNKGLVWSSRTQVLCLLRPDKKGGLMVQLLVTHSGQLKYHLVHSLVGDLFLPKRREGRYVTHKNGDRMDNRVENLAWCSQRELTRELLDSTRKMENPSMCSRVRVNLTPDQVITIRDAVSAGASRRALAQHYGVCYATIVNIIRRDTWGHLAHS